MNLKLTAIRALRPILAGVPISSLKLGRLRRRLELGELRATDILQYRFELARDMGVTVGANCRLLSLNIFSEPTLVDIGENTMISGNVVLLTHDGAICTAAREEIPDINGHYGRISIGKNCFIGFGAIILPNVRIGDNSIVGAGSVVFDSFPENSVIAGNPAKVLLPRSMYVRLKQNSPNTIVDSRFRHPAKLPTELLMERVGDLPIREPRRERSPGNGFPPKTSGAERH